MVTARVNTSPSQESRKVCSQWPPGFLPAGTGRWLWITARLRSCDFRPVTLNPHLPGPRCPEPHNLVPKCLSSEAMPQTRGQSSFPCGLPTGAAELGWAAIFTDVVPFQLQTLTLEVDDVSVAAADAHMGPAPALVGDISLNRKRSPGSGSLPSKSTPLEQSLRGEEINGADCPGEAL